MGAKIFTRFFSGTVLLEGAQPMFGSGIRPTKGDIIYGEDGSILQVQAQGRRLVEVIIDGPPRAIKLPHSWYTPTKILK